MIKKLTVKQFRIFDEKSIQLFHGINILLGKNGVGKTSLLEAIYYMNFTKSFKAPTDVDMIQIGKDYFQIQTEWDQAQYIHAQGNFLKQKGKRFIFDEETMTRISDVIGSFPMVFQSPEDFRVTSGPGVERRIYFDRFISQISRQYLQNMISYRKLLKNRNAYLKHLAELKQYHYTEQLEVYDLQLSPIMFRIVSARRKFIDLFNIHLKKTHASIFSGDITARINYKPSLAAEIETDFQIIHIEQTQKNIDKEIVLRRTLWGPNYDKYTFYRNDIPLIHYASQGEHKMWMILLKLAEGDIIKSIQGEEPIYLFDDLFAELDINNSQHIIEKVMRKKQTLITTTDLNDLRRHGIDTKKENIHIIEIS